MTLLDTLITRGATLTLTAAAAQGPPGTWPLERAEIVSDEIGVKALRWFLLGAEDEFGLHELRCAALHPHDGLIDIFDHNGALIATLAPAEDDEPRPGPPDPARSAWLDELFARSRTS